MRITSSAPTRIDLAGGTIDIWPLYLFHDEAMTLNVAISLRAHVTLESRADGRLELPFLGSPVSQMFMLRTGPPAISLGPGAWELRQ